MSGGGIPSGTIAVLVARMGPYHVARLTAATALLGPGTCIALEIAAESREYAWDRVEARGLRRLTLIADRDYQDVSPGERSARVVEVLDGELPVFVALSGWGFPEARAALAWCRRNDRVAILMSESQERDSARYWLKEKVKQQLMSDYDSALVGGASHADYLVKLGMDRSRIVTGYDVVDNDHFSRGADAARLRADEERQRFGLPQDYFLCSARFMPKKNLVALLAAFASYRKIVGEGAWHLVLLGDGPLRAALLEARTRLCLDHSVHFPGFKQYDELPSYYGLARAFVLPSISEQWGLVTNEAMAAGLPVLISETCGAAALVKQGQNGFVFKPNDPGELVTLMAKLTREQALLEAMSRNSRQLIASWSPSMFARGLAEAMKIGARHLSTRRRRIFPNPALWF